MALVKKKVSSIKWPVTCNLPSDGGKWVEEKFVAIFRKIGLDELTNLSEKGDPTLVKETIEGWEEYKDEEGNDIPFNQDELNLLLDDPHVLRGAVTALVEMTQQAPEKN